MQAIAADRRSLTDVIWRRVILTRGQLLAEKINRQPGNSMLFPGCLFSIPRCLRDECFRTAERGSRIRLPDFHFFDESELDLRNLVVQDIHRKVSYRLQNKIGPDKLKRRNSRFSVYR